jgi:hypothetical protein
MVALVENDKTDALCVSYLGLVPTTSQEPLPFEMRPDSFGRISNNMSFDENTVGSRNPSNLNSTQSGDRFLKLR